MTKHFSDYYVTKYALSKGQIGKLSLHSGLGDVYLYGENWMQQFRKGRDAFERFEDAQKAALAQRDKKIKSLRAQIAKLEKLTFDEARS